LEGPCRVFLTSTLYQGDLREGGAGSGIAGADAKCQARANASARTQGGTYKAWLSGSTDASSPAQRFTNTANTGPYVRVDDAATVIAADWADLTDGTLQNPINVTETGGVRFDFIWTNTQPDGTAGGTFPNAHCQEWTTSANLPNIGNVGQNIVVNSLWTEAGSLLSCNSTLRLYCVEQG
jgi:hypothetical protein